MREGGGCNHRIHIADQSDGVTSRGAQASASALSNLFPSIRIASPPELSVAICHCLHAEHAASDLVFGSFICITVIELGPQPHAIPQ